MMALLLLSACGVEEVATERGGLEPRSSEPEFVDPIPYGHPKCQECSGAAASCGTRYIYACHDGDRCGKDVSCDPRCCEGTEEPAPEPAQALPGFRLVAAPGDPWPAETGPVVRAHPDRLELEGGRVIHLPRGGKRVVAPVVIAELRDPLRSALTSDQVERGDVVVAAGPEASFGTLYAVVHSASMAGAKRVSLATTESGETRVLPLMTYRGRLALPTKPEDGETPRGLATVEVLPRGVAFWRGQKRLEEKVEVDAAAIHDRAVALFGSGALQVAADPWTPWSKVAPVVSALHRDFDQLTFVVVDEVPVGFGQTPYSDGSMTRAPSIEIGLTGEDMGELYGAGGLGLAE